MKALWAALNGLHINGKDRYLVRLKCCRKTLDSFVPAGGAVESMFTDYSHRREDQDECEWNCCRCYTRKKINKQENIMEEVFSGGDLE